MPRLWPFGPRRWACCTTLAFNLWLQADSAAEASDSVRDFALPVLDGWHSQYGQDKTILRWLYNEEASDAAYDLMHGRAHRQGVFIELGAGDGLAGSNTLAFEQKLNWTGLLIEPVQHFYEKLRVNRPAATCVHACVAGATGPKTLAESGFNSGTTGRLVTSSDLEKLVDMTCQTLGDLIDKHLGEMGHHIDYLSLDTEGTELEILATFDFNRYQVDVMSIEVDDALPEEMYVRLTRLLDRRGFRFLERLLVDEIWIRKTGLEPDPTCLYPSLQLGPNAADFSWASLRKALTSLLGVLLERPFDTLDVNVLGKEALALNHFFYKWMQEDLQDWERTCPAGMLTLGLAFVLLQNRFGDTTPDKWSLAKELRQQSVFHHTERILRLQHVSDYVGQIRESELSATPFNFRFPLGKAWHSTSFQQLLEARWPIFGLLDVVAKRMGKSGHLMEKTEYRGVEEHRPVPLPAMRCQLEVAPEDDLVRVAHKTPLIRRGKHRSTQSLLLDADGCNLLGIAAANFHQARSEIHRLVQNEASRFMTFDILHNWTAACSDQRSPELCTADSNEKCAALQDDHRRVSKACLRVHRSKRSTLRLRRRIRLRKTRAGFWIEEGERLFREFVARYDLQAAMWAAGQFELAPHTDRRVTFGTWPATEEVKHRATMFGILNSLQQDLFFPDDLLPPL